MIKSIKHFAEESISIFEKLEEENTELRKRLGEDVSEPRDCPCFRTEVGPAVDDIPNEK